jgi:hypothetical protein
MSTVSMASAFLSRFGGLGRIYLAREEPVPLDPGSALRGRDLSAEFTICEHLARGPVDKRSAQSRELPDELAPGVADGHLGKALVEGYLQTREQGGECRLERPPVAVLRLQRDARPAGPESGQPWAHERIQEGDKTCEENQVMHGEAMGADEPAPAGGFEDADSPGRTSLQPIPILRMYGIHPCPGIKVKLVRRLAPYALVCRTDIQHARLFGRCDPEDFIYIFCKFAEPFLAFGQLLFFSSCQ